MITNFNELFEALRSRSRKRMVAAWGVDDHTITAAARAIEKGIVDVTLVGDQDNELALTKRSCCVGLNWCVPNLGMIA